MHFIIVLVLFLSVSFCSSCTVRPVGQSGHNFCKTELITKDIASAQQDDKTASSRMQEAPCCAGPEGMIELPLLQHWVCPSCMPIEKGTASIWHTDSGLHFCVILQDKDIYTNATGHDQQLWRLGDTVEFFIKPDTASEKYYAIYVAPNGYTIDICIPSRTELLSGTVSWSDLIAYESRCSANVISDPHAGVWKVEVTIPWTAFELPEIRPVISLWKFAVCRYNYSKTVSEPELSSTAYLDRPDFHQYENYNMFVF